MVPPTMLPLVFEHKPDAKPLDGGARSVILRANLKNNYAHKLENMFEH